MKLILHKSTKNIKFVKVQQQSLKWLFDDGIVSNLLIKPDKKAIKRTMEIIDSILVEEKEEDYSNNSTISSSNTKK